MHGVANLRKGLMEHFNKTFFSTYQSASESKLKVIKGHSWTTNTAQVDTEFWLYVLLLMLFPCTDTIGAPQPRYVCMAATKTQEQLTKVQHIFLPQGSYQ